jgi:hypothetical protein
MTRAIPRSLEVLIKKAAIDQKFHDALLAGRSRLADEILLPLDPTERKMLDDAPEAQLRKMIEIARVSEAEKVTLGGANYGIAAAVVVGAGLLALISFLSTVSGDYGLFSQIKGTLGHTAAMIHSLEPPPVLRNSLDENLGNDVMGMPFREALASLASETGVDIRIEPHFSPANLHFPVKWSGKGRTRKETLQEICREALSENGMPPGSTVGVRYAANEIVIVFPMVAKKP